MTYHAVRGRIKTVKGGTNTRDTHQRAAARTYSPDGQKGLPMTHIDIDKLLTACDTLERRTQYAEGCMHTSTMAFNACMRAFDTKALPAEAVTFRIFFAAPVLRYGEATIGRDGSLLMHTVREA